MKSSRKINFSKLISLFIILLFITLYISACSNNDSSSSDDSQILYTLPQDHRFHYDEKYQSANYIEWLYFTGIVNDTKSSSFYGYQVNIFMVYSEEIGDFGYKTDIAISDVPGDKYYFSSFITFNDPTVTTENGETIWTYSDDGIYIRHNETTDVWEVSTNNQQTGDNRFQIDVTLTNIKKDYLPETINGVIEMGDCSVGNMDNMTGLSYYYTHPCMTTTGQLHTGSQTIDIEGSTWFDHQWGNFQQCPSNWDWFSLRFDDGSELMLFNFNKEGNNEETVPEKRTATYFASDGSVKYWSGASAFSQTPMRYYLSPSVNKTFRIEWLLETPVGDFYIKPYIDEQVATDEEDPYYEGIMEVRSGSANGTVVGKGYLETSFSK